MPDGDIFHGLSGLYQKPYRILCEGKLERNESARITMEAFLKDLKKKGAAAIVIAKGMGELLAQVIKDAANNQSIDWADLSKKLDRLAQQANIPNRTKSLVNDAGKSIFNDLRYGQQFDINTISETVIERYMQKVYVSEFEGRIPLITNHNAKDDNLTFTERIEALRNDIFSEIRKWAKKANVDEDVANLKRTRRSQLKEIDMEEDLVI
ncbi:hypothetical protein FJR38_17730 [Anabaena sp. UHCC 0253]|uniref:hypothetical protein n=1 Tax=Anabaena sp. UHCC 0253 TaxID=2590019 RepID=UPI0014463003|nr:hypothetical protein [Anabaena sp. UHCC 0253]MTJ54365.1 hypothetical protein [Anabaena sp. UHCC 0253]